MVTVPFVGGVVKVIVAGFTVWELKANEGVKVSLPQEGIFWLV